MAFNVVQAIAQFITNIKAAGLPTKHFQNIDKAEYPLLRGAELQSYQYNATTHVEGIPHTLGSFVWYNPIPETTTPPDFAQCILRPVAQGRLVEVSAEVSAPGSALTISVFKNTGSDGTPIATLTFGNAGPAVTTSISNKDFIRDDFFGYTVSYSGAAPANLVVYLRFYQYPYVLNDHQTTVPMPS